MSNIIRIKFGESLPCQYQDELRYRMEMGVWKAQMRQAEEDGNWDLIYKLEDSYETAGLP